MSTREPAPPVIRTRNLLGVLAFLRRYPVGLTVALSLLVVNIGIEMTLPRISGGAINRLLHPIEGVPFHPWHYAGLFVGLALIRGMIGFVLGRVRNRLIQRTLMDLRAAYFDAVQRLSFAYHDRTNTGELISRGTADISRLQEFLVACLFLGVDIAVALTSTLVLITIISPAAGLVTFLTMAPTVGLIVYYARRLQPQWRKVHDLHGKMTTTIQENIAGVRVVKAFAREPDEIVKFTVRLNEFVGQMLSTTGYWATRVPMAQFIFGLSIPLVLWIGGREVIAGRLPVGNLVMIVSYLMGIGGRMAAVGQFVSVIQNAGASAERIMEVLQEPSGIRSGTKRPSNAHGAHLVLENVGFKYPTGATALEGISFEVKPGQTTAIVGATGAGKTTLVHLIPRFYDPTSGAVRLDGVDVRELDLLSLRRSVGMIFQETVLFSATVAANVAYGRPEATQEQIVAAARAAHAHEFIMELENKYETVIGERGVSLSGGQKQRLAIARAFLLDPRILIMDDATSSLDSKTERLIQQDMWRVCIGRTALVIAHRLTTVQHADQVIVLKEGRIVERGAPAELTARGGWFEELFRDQRETSTGSHLVAPGIDLTREVKT
jgi:ATP-binding cassette subfamily B protein